MGTNFRVSLKDSDYHEYDGAFHGYFCHKPTAIETVYSGDVRLEDGREFRIMVGAVESIDG